jgi:hypothetical protein
VAGVLVAACTQSCCEWSLFWGRKARNQLLNSHKEARICGWAQHTHAPGQRAAERRPWRRLRGRSERRKWVSTTVEQHTKKRGLRHDRRVAANHAHQRIGACRCPSFAAATRLPLPGRRRLWP